MLSVLDPLLSTFFELLKNKFLTWIASGGKKVDESRKLGVVVRGKFAYSGRFAPLPCTVYLVKYAGLTRFIKSTKLDRKRTFRVRV